MFLNRQQRVELEIKGSNSALTSHARFQRTSLTILRGNAVSLSPQSHRHPWQNVAASPRVSGDKEFGESPNLVHSQCHLPSSHPLQILSYFLHFYFFPLFFFSFFLLCLTCCSLLVVKDRREWHSYPLFCCWAPHKTGIEPFAHPPLALLF
jgi:hypothetical protein